MKTGVQDFAEVVDLHEEEINNGTIYYPIVRALDQVKGPHRLENEFGLEYVQNNGSKMEVV